ncbi:MAG: PKD domain-containing protein [Bacteroidetes bacterium]|nr:MAG: PKD domain-containing protein [Bacteroidota bacterium]
MKTILLSVFLLFTVALHSQCIESLPFTESFSSTDWAIPSTSPNAGSIDACWSRDGITDLYWRPNQGTTPLPNTGPLGDHTTGTGKYVFLEHSGIFNSKTQASLITTWVDLSGAINPQLRYWRHMYGFGVGSLIVQVQTYGSSTWSTLGSTTGITHNSYSDPWTEGVQSLTTYLNDTVRFRFVGSRLGSATQCNIALDDITVIDANGCSTPNNLNVQLRTQTSVTLNWFSTNTTGTLIKYFKVSGGSVTPTVVNAGISGPYTVTGLDPGTEYGFYVRDSCGVGNVGPWHGPIFTNTLCGLISAPWTEGFEGPAFVPSSSTTQVGSIHPCWVRTPSTPSPYVWVPGPNAVIFTQSGPSTGHNSSKWMMCDRTSFSSTSLSASFRSPHIDLSTLTNPELRYWYHMYGANIDRLEVEINTGTGGWQLLQTISGQQQLSKTDPWIEEAISLSAYANQTVFLRFKGYNNGNTFLANIAIDDVSIDEAPPCPRPNPFTLTSQTSTTATFSFTSGGTSPWQVEYGAPGFSPGSGTLQNVTSNPFTLTGLTPQTTYDVYMRDTCGAIGVSLWTGPLSVTTECAPSSAPFSEGFEGSSFTPGSFGVQGGLDPCWSASSDQTGYYWTPSPPSFINFASGPNTAHSGSDYMYTDGGFIPGASDTAVLTSPLIDLAPLTNPELTFWYHMFGPQINSLKVQVFDGTSWLTEWSVSGQQHHSKSAAWLEATVDLTSYAGSTIQIRFVGKRSSATGDDLRIAIDDVDIHEQPPCPKVTGFSFIGKSQTSINLVWNVASGTNWIIEYGYQGFSPGSGTVITGVTGSPYNVTGLSPSTAYDFYITRDCGTNGTSDVTGPLTVSTVCGPVAAPFVETFESPGWVKGTFFPDLGSLEPCWTRSDTTSFIWSVENLNTFPNNSGPDGDHTTGSGNYMYTDFRSTANVSTFLQMPNIDLSPLDTPELRFFYHMYGAAIDHLKVQVKTASSSWTDVWSRNGQQQTSSSASFNQAILNLSAYRGQIVMIRFVGQRLTSGFTNSEIAIDDISIDEKPQCPAPSGLTTTPVSVSAIQLSWTAGGGVSTQIEYGPQGFSPGSGTLVNAPNNPFIVTGLSANTAYDFYVRDSCGTGGVSWANGPVSGTTYPCADACLYELVLSDLNNDGWNAGGLNGLHVLEVTVDGTTTDYTLTSGSLKSFLVPICNNQPFSLKFINNGFLSNQCGIIFKDPSGATLYSRNPSNAVLGTAVLYSDTGSCATVCPDPVGLTANNITPISADILWSSISGDARIAYGPVGFTPGTPYQTGLATSYTLTGLTPGTTYDVYVQDTCTNGLVSGWVGPLRFTTLNCNPPSAAFTATASGLVATFDGSSSSSNVTTHTWYYGDGNSGGGMSNAHTYSSPGIYQVVLVVSNPCGILDSAVQTLVVCGTPTAAFTSNKSGLNISLDASSSTGIGMSYAWDFGDGNTGTGVTTTHVYAAAGNYSVRLIVTDTCGSDDTSIVAYTICAPTLPVITYTTTGMTVNFDGSGSVNALTYDWDFGDGNSGTGVNPSHTYALNQNYTVTLTITNACGDTSLTDTVIALCTEPIAKWTYNIISSGGSGMLVQFDGTASVGTTYNWDFGDGGTVSGTNFPTHTYTTPGLFYWVTLIVGNDCSDSDTMRYKLNQIGLEEVDNDEHSISLYPNPSSGSFTLKFDNSSQGRVEVNLLDVGGKSMIQDLPMEDQSESEFRVQVVVPPGVYMLQIVMADRIHYKRLVIQ